MEEHQLDLSAKFLDRVGGKKACRRSRAKNYRDTLAHLKLIITFLYSIYNL